MCFHEACKRPSGISFVPRLLWHRFYNWAAESIDGSSGDQHTQQDAHEHLQVLVDEVMSPGLFLQTRAQLQQIMRCKTDGCVHRDFSVRCYETVLSLDLLGAPDSAGQRGKHLTVQAALDAYLEGEDAPASFLHNGESWRCNACSSSALPVKQYDIIGHPNTLLLHLKRWHTARDDDHPDGFRTYPVFHHVDVEDVLVLSGVSYAARAIVIHTGASIHSGHYVCLCKCSQGGAATGDSWWFYDDATRRESRPNDFQNGHSYLLVYDRVSLT